MARRGLRHSTAMPIRRRRLSALVSAYLGVASGMTPTRCASTRRSMRPAATERDRRVPPPSARPALLLLICKVLGPNPRAIVLGISMLAGDAQQRRLSRRWCSTRGGPVLMYGAAADRGQDRRLTPGKPPPRRKSGAGIIAPMLTDSLLDEARAIEGDIVALRHYDPCRTRTGPAHPADPDKVRAALARLPLEWREGASVYSLVATLRGGAGGGPACCCAATWTPCPCRRRGWTMPRPFPARCTPAGTIPTPRCWSARRVYCARGEVT